MMHQALQLPEILDIVCSFSDQGTLARLARTCRKFEDPSLNALWRKLESVEDILSRLSAAIFHQPKGDVHNTVTHPCQPLPTVCDPNQWQRIRRYTTRIVSVEFMKYTFMSRPKWNLDWLAYAASLPEPMFPKLKKVHISGARSLDIMLISYVTGPSLTYLWWFVDSGRWDANSILSASLVSLYPSARTVHLVTYDNGSSPPEELVQNLSLAIRGWGHLVDGWFTVLDSLAYEHLCRLETLTSLRIHLSCHDNQLRLQAARLPSEPFPVLTDLHLTAYTTADLVEWIRRHNRFPLVSNLACDVERLRRKPLLEPHDLCNSIATCFHPGSLQKIRLSSGHLNTAQFILLGTICPLLSFNRLRSVILCRFGTFSMNDGDLETIASSWPLLEELVLNYYVPANTRSRGVHIPTFKGLFKLIEHCPRLRALSIVIDTRDTAWINLRDPCSGVSAHMLSDVTFGNSPINDSEQVASILKAIFPSLDRVRLGNKDTLPMDIPEEILIGLLWDEVNASLRKGRGN